MWSCSRDKTITSTAKFGWRKGNSFTATDKTLPADHPANKSGDDLRKWLNANHMVTVIYDNGTSELTPASYSTQSPWNAHGGSYRYVVYSGEVDDGPQNMTLTVTKAAAAAPAEIQKPTTTEYYEKSDLGLPATVTVSYTGTGATTQPQELGVTWTQASDATNSGKNEGSWTFNGAVAGLPAWASGSLAPTVTVKIVDKTPLTDEQMNLAVSGWVYGAQDAPAPIGSVTVTGDNGTITYTYSADGGTTWPTAENLPKSAGGKIKAGSYSVKMSYEGDQYSGSKTAAFTVTPKALTVSKGTLAVTPKPYDGKTDAVITGAAALDGVISGDAVSTATVTTGTFAAAGPDDAIAVTVTGFTPLSGADNPDYITTKAALDAVHIITNVTPTLGHVTLPANWSFDAPATRLAGIEGQNNQNFAVKYTSQDPAYEDVAIAAQPFPVTTILMDVQGGLSMVTLNKTAVKDIAPVTISVKGAPLPNSGDYAESNIGLFSALEKIATIDGKVGADQGTVNVTGVAKGLTMVGIAYKNTPNMMLSYILIQVNDPAASSENNIEEIKDIGDTLERLITDPGNPSPVEQATVNAVASEITKLPDTAKEQLVADDVKKIDELQQAVQKITVTPTLPVVPNAPTLANNFSVVGAAVSSGAAANSTVAITATPKPVSGDVKIELDLAMTVSGAEQRLKSPLFFEMELPAGIDPAKLKINHILASGSTEEVTFTSAGQTVSFKLDSFSGLQFVVAGGGGGGSTSGGSGGGSGGGSSYRDSEYDFWQKVRKQIEKSADGDTVKAGAKSYDRMPENVMDALRKHDGVTLDVAWNGGASFTIPAGEALLRDGLRVYYPLSYLEELYNALPAAGENPETRGPDMAEIQTGGTVPGKSNPATGGVWEVEAPDVPAGQQAVMTMTPKEAGTAATEAQAAAENAAAGTTPYRGVLLALSILLFIGLSCAVIYLRRRLVEKKFSA